MKKYTFLLALALSGLVVLPPAPVLAASSSAAKKQIQKLTSQLKKLPNGASASSKVSSLVKKLSKLDPKKASQYYKIGLTKLQHTAENDRSATSLAKAVNTVVKKSGLTPAQVKKITSMVAKSDDDFEADIIYADGPGGTTIGALTGDVTITLPDGKTIEIEIGTGATITENGTVTSRGTIAQLAASNPAFKDALKQAVADYAAQVATDPNIDPAVASVKLAALVQIASEADPAGAAGYVRTATQAVLRNPDLRSEGTIAISTIVNAATSGNPNVNKQAVMDAASDTASGSGVTFNQTVFEQDSAEVAERVAENQNLNITVDLDARRESAGGGN